MAKRRRHKLLCLSKLEWREDINANKDFWAMDWSTSSQVIDLNETTDSLS